MIRLLTSADLPQAVTVLQAVKKHMIEQGIDQWDEEYPTPEILANDILNKQAFAYFEQDKLIAYMVLNELCDPEYDDIRWQYAPPFLVMHRLFVGPSQQGKGISSKMLAFVEQYAKQQQYNSIRFDTYAKNPTANAVYTKKNYRFAGTVTFSKGLFNCFEKQL
ncbi:MULTISPECIES: GNAT family N-acetyltransferase [unclassified Myroides]|uniref:GNAT family N-acetyltransferase n=1 Tax=unclassified Myroides TaxID=2642485 RepID=UPI003100C8BF